MKNKTIAVLAGLCTLLVCGVAYAQAPDLENKPIESLFELVALIKSGSYRLVVAFALSAAMLGLNRYREKIPFLGGDRGGAISVVLLAVLGSISAALYSDSELSASLFMGALATAFTAAGGYTVVKKILWPSDAEEAEIK